MKFHNESLVIPLTTDLPNDAPGLPSTSLAKNIGFYEWPFIFIQPYITSGTKISIKLISFTNFILSAYLTIYSIQKTSNNLGMGSENLVQFKAYKTHLCSLFNKNPRPINLSNCCLTALHLLVVIPFHIIKQHFYINISMFFVCMNLIYWFHFWRFPVDQVGSHYVCIHSLSHTKDDQIIEFDADVFCSFHIFTCLSFTLIKELVGWILCHTLPVYINYRKEFDLTSSYANPNVFQLITHRWYVKNNWCQSGRLGFIIKLGDNLVQTELALF